MTTMPSKLGPYTVDRELGRGGMGVVYLGHDTKLDRAVAIKALPEHLAQDTDRLARFEREARTLAQLSHPNVAGIFGVEESEDHRYLILEYVEGETLAQRLNRGALPVDESIDLAIRIASGIEAAHGAGVIHRDLKPGNVIVSPDGQAKVLDFGLARSEEQGSSISEYTSESPTLTSPAQHSPTMPGVILGTAPYMSPEQARGRSVDKRTDIWSFGVILYEMLTGVSPFLGESATDSIGAILHKDVDLERLPPGAPANVPHVLRRCLQRDRNLRYRDIGDAALDLSTEAPSSTAAPAPGRRAAWIGALIGVAALSSLITFALTRTGPPPQPERTRFVLSETVLKQSACYPLVLSPRGDAVAFVDHAQNLCVRRFDEFEARIVPGTTGARSPFFSPDGRWVGFWMLGKLRRVPAEGDDVLIICDCRPIRRATWSADNTIVFSETVSGLFRVNADGGEPASLTTLAEGQSGTSHMYPEFLPGGRSVLFHDDHTGIGGIRAARVPSGEIVTLTDEGYDARYDAASGTLLYRRHDGSIWGAPFDPDELRLTGPVRLVMRGPVASFDLANDGTLAYLPGLAEAVDGRLVWVDRSGNASPLPFPPDTYLHARLSPDQRRIAAARINLETGDDELWLLDIERETRTRLSREGPFHRWPVWTHGGRRIAFSSVEDDRVAMVSVPADGSRSPSPIVPRASLPIPLSWDEQSRTLLFYDYAEGRRADLWTIGTDSEPAEFLSGASDERGAVFSPDGKMIAYVSDESGRDEVYILPHPGPGVPRQVSFEGGDEPEWSTDGAELFFRSGPRMMVASIDPPDSDRPGVPQVLFENPRLMASPIGRGNPNFDAAADGRFLMIEAVPNSPAYELHVIRHWARDLAAS